MCTLSDTNEAVSAAPKTLIEKIQAILESAGIDMPRVRTNRASKTINFPAEGGTITRKDRDLIRRLNGVLSVGRGQTPLGVINHNFFWDGTPSTITISMPL